MKRLPSIILLAATGLSLTAAPVTREQAKERAAAFISQTAPQRSTAAKARSARAVTLSSVNTGKTDEQLYLFNIDGGGGFVIVAADEDMSILGYSDHGALNPDDMPEALRLMIDSYDCDKIAAARARAPRKAPTANSDMKPVKPLLKTMYNQSGVYNMYLPIVKQPDEEGYGRRMAPTGCVSVAMAQVIAYWQWPKRVEAIPGYVMDKTGSDDHITVYAKNPNCTEGDWMDVFTPESGEVKPLPAYNINWDNIYQGSYDDDFFKGKWSSASSYNKKFTSYWSGETLTKMQEIGRLFLYACSSLQMYYTYTGSGAKSADMITLLPKYFGYKNQIKKNERRNFTQAAWEQLLYNEISNGRPVIYAGKAQKATGGTGGHAYIMDGYDGQGLWHVNWGWNGSCDGYYDFENLSPYGLPDDTDGYTVSETGYVLNQICLTGIEPNTREGKLTVVDSEMKDNENGEPSVYIYVDNMSNEEVSRSFTWAILKDDGTLENKAFGSKRTLTMPPSSTLSYDSKDQWYDSEHVDAHRRYYNATIEELKTKFKLESGSSYKIVAVARPATSSSWSDYVIADGAEEHVFNINIESTYDNSAEAADATVDAAGNFTVAALESLNSPSTGKLGLKAWYDNENDETRKNRVSWALLKDDGSINKRYNSGWAKTIIPKRDATYQLKDDSYLDDEGNDQSRSNFISIESLFAENKFNITEPGTYKIAPTVNSKGTTVVNDYELAIGTDEHYFLVTLEKDEEGNVSYTVKLSTDGLFTVAATEVKEKDGVPTLYAYFDNENTDEISSTVTWALLKSDGKLSGGYQNYKTLTLPTLSSCTYGKTDESFMVGETERSRYYFASVERIQKELKLTESGTYTVVPVMSNKLKDLKLPIGSVKHAFTITVDEHQNVTATTTTTDIPNAANRLTVSYVEYKDGNLRAYFDNPNADVTTNSINIRRLKEDGSYQSYGSTAKDLTLPTSSTANTATTTTQVTLNGKKVDRYYEIGAEEILKKCGLIQTVDDVTTYTAGTYTFHMCCKPADGSAYQPCEGTDKYYFTVELAEDGTISVVAHPEKKVTLNSCKVIGDFLTGTVHELQATFQNTSNDELAGQIVFQIIPVTYDENNNPVDGTDSDELKSTYVLHGKSTETFKLAYTFNEAGNYKVRARLELGGGTITKWKPSSYFEIKQKTTEQANSQLTLDFAGIEGVQQVGNRFYLTGNALEGKAVVTNTGDASTTNEMNTIIQLWSKKNPAKENLIDQVRIKGIVAPGQTIELPFHFRNLDLTPGHTYYFRTSYGTNGLTTEGYNGWNTTNDNHWYEVKGTPCVTTWNTDGKETQQWVVPVYEGNVYTYVFNSADAVAADLTGMEAVMKTTATDTYQLVPATNPNCLYFVSSTDVTPAELEGKNIVTGQEASVVSLTDGQPFLTPRAFTAKTVNFSRTFEKGMKKKQGGGWQTLVVPFEVQNVTIDGTEVSWFKHADDDAYFWVYAFTGEKADQDFGFTDVVFDYAAAIEANKPYIVAVPDESWGKANSLVGKTITFSADNVAIEPAAEAVVGYDSYEFVGTYTGEQVDNAYILNAEGTTFEHGAGTVAPFRAWLRPKTPASSHAARLRIHLADDLTTGIGGKYMATDGNATKTYDLQGRQVDSSLSSSKLSKGLYIIGGKKLIK
ncbi:MAG: C10 family peptidase [Prevotella sp.]|nr:C10 family peptidase [Prevotella sp.]